MASSRSSSAARRLVGLLVVLAAFAGAAAARADTLVMLDGDRISGRLVRETARTIYLQTPWGRLTIPKSKVERWTKKDGTEVTLNAPAADARPAPSPTPSTRSRLVLVVTGKSFWHAWDPKEAPTDPSLRLEATMDEEPLAAFVDARLDPNDLPKAVVNTFSFLSEDVRVAPAEGVTVDPPETRAGRVLVRLSVPGPPRGGRLRLAYAMNTGTAESPSWRDLAEASVALDMGETTFVTIRQDMGRMSFSGFPKKKMKDVGTFVIEIRPE